MGISYNPQRTVRIRDNLGDIQKVLGTQYGDSNDDFLKLTALFLHRADLLLLMLLS